MNLRKKTFFIINFSCFLVLIWSSAAFSQIEEYVLKPGDVISITVVEHPEFSGRHKIRPDGKVNYPVIGELEVASLTCAQLVKVMESKLTSYVNNPIVSVSIEAYYANKIYIIGDVRNSGEYEIYEPLGVLKALAMSGGVSGSIDGIKIIRADGTVIDVPMGDNLLSNTRNEEYTLYPGDTMYVPEEFKMPWGLISTIISIISSGVVIAWTFVRIAEK